jgi:hypothetical protein
MRQMECTDEAWSDWVSCNNEYAEGDHAAVDAGALEYLNTTAVVLRKI